MPKNALGPLWGDRNLRWIALLAAFRTRFVGQPSKLSSDRFSTGMSIVAVA